MHTTPNSVPDSTSRRRAAYGRPRRARRCCQSRAIAPWRIGSSTYRHESAAIAERQRDRDRPPDDTERSMVRIDEHDDRPLPQVDAVGAHAEPSQRCDSECEAEPAARGSSPRRSRAGRKRQQQESPRVQEPGERVRPRDQQGDDDEADDAGEIEDRPRLLGSRVRVNQLAPRIASAAPISSSNARVSVPSYARVGSYPGWKVNPSPPPRRAPARVMISRFRRVRRNHSPPSSSHGQTM